MNSEVDINKIEKKDQTNTTNNEFHLLSEAIRALVKSNIDFNGHTMVFNEFILKQEEDKKRDKKSVRFDKWGIAFLTLIGVFISVSTTMYQFSKQNSLKMKFQYEQGIQAQIRQQIQSLDSLIQDKVSKRDNANQAMSKARNLLEVSNLYCKNNIFSGDKKAYSEKQINDIYQIVNATYAINQIFDQKLYEQIRYFLFLFDENREPCNKKDNFELKLRELQFKINVNMNNSIASDQQKKDEFVTKLTNSPIWEE